MPPLHGTSGTPISGSAAPALTGAAAASCLTLPRYARIIGYDEHRFMGVQRTDWLEYQCREYWTRDMRQDVARYLAVAQSMIESELKYPLCPQWFEDEEHPFGNSVTAIWRHLIEMGVMATAVIQADAPVVHSSDPAVIGPIATTVTDTAEIHVYYPGTDEEIVPQQVVISGGQLTIYIPRCRMVLISRQGGTVDYDTLTDFADAVDVVRVYNDPSQQGTLIWPHVCGVSCSSEGCSETTQTACIYPMNRKMSIVNLQPATYADGTWTRASAAYQGRPSRVRLNYRAGLTAITPQMEDAIVRLAHTLMPQEPCGCASTQRLWKRDRNIPMVLDRERLNCPFGMMDGAWIAWQMARAKRVIRLGTI